jgi:deazaflavin-dependent oxidoreductase (nitroreductase family)
MAIPFAVRLARFNTRYTNRVLGPIAWYLPGFGRVEHVGRRTGRSHVAPMMAFRSPDGRRLAFVLTYGPEAEWVRNVMAAGDLTYVSRRDGRLHLVAPRLVHDPRRTAMPWAVRQILRVLRVEDFLVATIER